MNDEEYNKMLKKLDELYEREDKLKLELEQLNDDKELLQNMIMYKFNKQDRQLNNKPIHANPKKNFNGLNK
jgi:gamma-glutamylcyclotransferase (GGCT)/AIG2-like uncharacterized protein YtfP